MFKMKTSSLIILILAVSLLSFLTGFFLSNSFSKNITGETIDELPNTYTYTKAICNSNQCLDILIECKNKEVISIKPISDFKDKSQEFTIPNNQTFCK